MSQSEIDDQNQVDDNIHIYNEQVDEALQCLHQVKSEIARLQSIVDVHEIGELPLQKNMLTGDYKIKKTVDRLAITKGEIVACKIVIERIINWILEDDMYLDGKIYPTNEFSDVFEMTNESSVQFPQVITKLRSILQ